MVVILDLSCPAQAGHPVSAALSVDGSLDRPPSRAMTAVVS